MGKASSTKKAARVAKQSSGKKVRSTQGLVFPLALGLVLLLGLALVVYARQSRPGVDTATPPTLDDHWHAAYGIWGCDKWLPDIQNTKDDVNGTPIGIHTHGDGVIHIHPFTSSATGENATLEVFQKTSDLELSNTKLVQPEVDSTFENGDDCKGKEGNLRVLVWDNANSTADPKVYVTDFDNIRFTSDRMAITIAFVNSDEDLTKLKPLSIPTLDNLSDVSNETEPTTTVPGASTTAPDGSTTTVAGATTTTAGGSTTTAAATTSTTSG
ncbi:MAG TPA: hypothetical protein VF855_00540 [Acidimicrobiales bacterium]